MATKVPATQLSLKHLRAHELGFVLVEVVEKRQIVHGQKFSITQDLFGIIDIIALGPSGTLAVQTTSYTNFSSRMKKLREHPSTRLVLATPGWRIEVHGWAKEKNRWQLKRCKEFVLDQPQQEEDD